MRQATAAELEAILHGAAVAPLSAPGYESFARAFLRITGSDATRWLNGMVTNSIQALSPGEGNYNFLLNAQGRIQADCTIYREPHENEPTFLLEADSSQLEAISNMLDRFIIMDDVELQPNALIGSGVVAETGLRLLGPAVPELVRTVINDRWEGTLQLLPGTIEYARANGAELLVMSNSAGAVHHVELWFEHQTEEGLVADLLKAKGAVAVSPTALEAFRILSGTPRFGTDIRDRDLPQETNQTHALHFSKGCYLGQEIVERIRSRGQVHRLFTPFRLAGDLPTTLPAPLTTADGKPAGELTSAALVPLPGGPQLLALGYARREFLETRKELTYPGGAATPRSASESLTTDI